MIVWAYQPHQLRAGAVTDSKNPLDGPFMTSRDLTRGDDLGGFAKPRPGLQAKLAVVLDFSAVHQAGDRTFPIDERNVSLPRGIRLVRSIPARLQFQLVAKKK